MKMARLSTEDRLLIKALKIEKGWSVDRMITQYFDSGKGEKFVSKFVSLYHLVRKSDYRKC